MPLKIGLDVICDGGSDTFSRIGLGGKIGSSSF
jgi:hypothetical protein